MSRLATYLLLAGLTGAPLTVAAAESPAGPDAPVAVVAQLHEILLKTMQAGDALDCAARTRLLEPTVNQSFDAAEIARAAFRRYWRDLPEDLQEEAARHIARLVLLSYASRFHHYQGERFADPEVARVEGERAIVRSTLHRPGRDGVSLNYVLQHRQEGWRIVNVIAGGVSDLALRSAQYASIIRKQGVDALQQRLTEQVEEQSAAC